MLNALRINNLQFGMLAVVCMYNFTPSFPLRSGVPSGIRYLIERQGWQRSGAVRWPGQQGSVGHGAGTVGRAGQAAHS